MDLNPFDKPSERTSNRLCFGTVIEQMWGVSSSLLSLKCENDDAGSHKKASSDAAKIAALSVLSYVKADIKHAEQTRRTPSLQLVQREKLVSFLLLSQHPSVPPPTPPPGLVSPRCRVAGSECRQLVSTLASASLSQNSQPATVSHRGPTSQSRLFISWRLTAEMPVQMLV